jgi:hypothetical protein
MSLASLFDVSREEVSPTYDCEELVFVFIDRMLMGKI